MNDTEVACVENHEPIIKPEFFCFCPILNLHIVRIFSERLPVGNDGCTKFCLAIRIELIEDAAGLAVGLMSGL